MKKIIFLDIDGVLVTSEVNTLDDLLPEFNNKCLNNFEKLLDNIGDCEIIISSTRRKSNSIDGLKNIFRKRNFKYVDKIAGITPVIYRGYDKILRGEEIDKFLKNSNFTYNTKYLILDDDSDFFPHQLNNFIQTQFNKGFTEVELGKALKILR